MGEHLSHSGPVAVPAVGLVVGAAVVVAVVFGTPDAGGAAVGVMPGLPTALRPQLRQPPVLSVALV